MYSMPPPPHIINWADFIVQLHYASINKMVDSTSWPIIVSYDSYWTNNIRGKNFPIAHSLNLRGPSKYTKRIPKSKISNLYAQIDTVHRSSIILNPKIIGSMVSETASCYRKKIIIIIIIWKGAKTIILQTITPTKIVISKLWIIMINDTSWPIILPYMKAIRLTSSEELRSQCITIFEKAWKY